MQHKSVNYVFFALKDFNHLEENACKHTETIGKPTQNIPLLDVFEASRSIHGKNMKHGEY